MRWLMRLFGFGGDSRPEQAAHLEASRTAEVKLVNVEKRWSEQKQRMDPVMDEVARVEQLIRGDNASPH